MSLFGLTDSRVLLPTSHSSRFPLLMLIIKVCIPPTHPSVPVSFLPVAVINTAKKQLKGGKNMFSFHFWVVHH